VTQLDLRQAVRGLMIDPSDRVLLVRVEFQDWAGWLLPGGGKEGEEDDRAALHRELVEETGVPDVFMGPALWVRRILWPKDRGSRWDGQLETVYLVPCHAFEIAPKMTVAELAAEGLVGHRWWSHEELATTDEVVLPTALPDLVKDVLEFGAPATPHRLEG
jgi:8-oxo-dGTP pyrophosphatase MutT (NUDIX family)